VRRNTERLFTRYANTSAIPTHYTQRALSHDLGMGSPIRSRPFARESGQIECTINVSASAQETRRLEEVVVALAVRKESFGVTTGIRLEELFPTSRIAHGNPGHRLLRIKPSSPNAFGQRAGIHQMDQSRTRLLTKSFRPQTVGVPARSLVLGKHSGRMRCASRARLGTKASDPELAEVYAASPRWPISLSWCEARDIVAIAHEVIPPRPAAMAAESSSAA